MKISHKKQILNVLPILNNSDEAWAWSWIYSAFIFSILEVWRAVILLLKTILWGLLFGNLVPCVAVYRKTPRLYRNCYVIILKWRNSREHCMYNEIWWNNKTEKVWHLLVCVFMSLLLLIMFFEIVSICRRHADPNGVPHLLRTLHMEHHYFNKIVHHPSLSKEMKGLMQIKRGKCHSLTLFCLKINCINIRTK